MDIAKPKSVRQPWQVKAIRFTPYIFIIMLLCILPPFMPLYLQSLMTKVLIFAIYAMSMDLIFGYTGLITLGHAAFFGIAGYTGGILVVHFGVDNFWLVAAGGVLMATLCAAIFGVIALRVSGLFFLMVTLALAELLYAVVFNWIKVTGGAFGLRDISHPELGIPGFSWDPVSIYFFVLLIFIACYFVLHRIVNSPYGYALQGIRKNEARLRSLGYNTWLYKYTAFIAAGFFAGIGGVLFILWNGLIAPMHIGFLLSAYGQLYVILGGAATLFGPAIGAGLMVILEFYTSLYFPERWPFILGMIFIITILFLRGGISPHLITLWKKIARRYGYGSIKD